MSRHKTRLSSASQSATIYQVRTIYQKYLAAYPASRGKIRTLLFVTQYQPGHFDTAPAAFFCDEGILYTEDDVALVVPY